MKKALLIQILVALTALPSFAIPVGVTVLFDNNETWARPTSNLLAKRMIRHQKEEIEAQYQDRFTEIMCSAYNGAGTNFGVVCYACPRNNPTPVGMCAEVSSQQAAQDE